MVHSGLNKKYFQHCDVTNCPAPRIKKRTEPWHHCIVLNRTVNFVSRYTPNTYTYIYIVVVGRLDQKCQGQFVVPVQPWSHDMHGL